MRQPDSESGKLVRLFDLAHGLWNRQGRRSRQVPRLALANVLPEDGVPLAHAEPGWSLVGRATAEQPGIDALLRRVLASTHTMLFHEVPSRGIISTLLLGYQCRRISHDLKQVHSQHLDERPPRYISYVKKYTLRTRYYAGEVQNTSCGLVHNIPPDVLEGNSMSVLSADCNARTAQKGTLRHKSSGVNI